MNKREIEAMAVGGAIGGLTYMAAHGIVKLITLPFRSIKANSDRSWASATKGHNDDYTHTEITTTVEYIPAKQFDFVERHHEDPYDPTNLTTQQRIFDANKANRDAYNAITGKPLRGSDKQEREFQDILRQLRE
jgi:hypothetical protein